MTSTVRALEVLPDLVGDDTRIRVVFAIDDTSAFSAGVPELLRAHNCGAVPWEQLESLHPDLVLSASENVDIPGTCPVLVIPHGVGFHKWVPDSRAHGVRLSGVVAESLLKRTRMVISHPGQLAQLAELGTAAAAAAVETGDVCYERLLASRLQRGAYRRAFGLTPGQRLVVLSSTWGPSSLLAKSPDLPSRLLSELPLDQYRVALVAHPNVWSFHGGWQLRAVQRTALTAGLILIPATRGWQAAVIAADAVIGDHGSVTYYSACLDRPTALAAYGDEAVAGTSGAVFGREAPRLVLGARLYEQVEDLIASHRSGRWKSLSAKTFANPDQATRRLRSLFYQMLKLPEPTEPVRVRAFPPPARERERSVASVVTIRPGRAAGTLTVERVPAAVTPVSEEDWPAVRFLVCDRDERDTGLLLSASVVVVPGMSQQESDEAAEAVREALDQCPGALLAVAALGETVCLVQVADGRRWTVRLDGAHVAPYVAAAVVYWWVRTGSAPDKGWFEVELAPGRAAWVSLEPPLPTRPADKPVC